MTKDRDNDDDDNESDDDDDATMIICLLHGIFRSSFFAILFSVPNNATTKQLEEKDHCIRNEIRCVFAQQVFVFP